MLRKSLRISTKLILIVLTVAALHLSILASPQKLFTNHITLGRYEVYSDSVITPELLINVFDADLRVSESELYDSGFRANIFFCANPDLYSDILFLIGMNGNSSGVNLSIFNNTFINLDRIKRMREYRDPRITHSHLTGDICQIIAHELTHNLVGNYLGFFESRELPRWKAEGYSEYISTIAKIRQDSCDNFSTCCELFYKRNLFNINPHSKFYYRSQILTEFLFEQEKYSFNKFRDSVLHQRTVEMKLLSWLNPDTTSDR